MLSVILKIDFKYVLGDLWGFVTKEFLTQFWLI